MGAAFRKGVLSFILFAGACNAWATSKTTDQSDIWFVASESGWGMQLVQRDNTIFATLFVYGPNNQPTWFVATMQHSASLTWTGPLYATAGPWFATVPFDPASVGVTQVGSMTWTAPFVNSGTVTYTVNGTTVTKNMVRQTLTLDDFSGTYAGALHGEATNCFTASNNATVEAFVGLAVSQTGGSAALSYAGQNGSGCTLSGTLSEVGQFGNITGNYTCTGGEVGTFQVFELRVGFNDLGGRFSMNSTNIGCQSTGYFAGMRHR